MPNRLADEKSPYLLQHADNPVDWYPWGDESLAKAKQEDKPIFLSIGYATCHWCHVMAHESFEDPEVAGLLNEHYVAIKVDREERPDLDAIYMTVCQALTGRGGWPLTVFLTPEGKPFYAGTYFPKNTRPGLPGLMQILAEIANRWQGPQRQRMLEAGEQITKAVTPAQAPAGELSEGSLGAAYHLLERSFDHQFGGFGAAPKFPTPTQLNFLLRYHLRQPESQALAMVERTLEAMRDGGIFDQVGLGFHRYSVDQRWLAPHFEKMLYDQALLAMAYLEAHHLTGRQEHAAAARDIFEYVLRDMTSPQGAFFSAEDADSEGEEGTFYLWTPAQVDRVLGPELGGRFCRFYDIGQAGNFERGLSIPHRSRELEDFARQEGRDPEEVEAELEQARQRLFAQREQRPHPLKDDKVLTAWNGLMIAALAMGFRVLGEKAYLTAAQRAADFLLAQMSDGRGRLWRRWREGQLHQTGFLEDYAFVIWGLIELYQAGFRLDDLEQAARLSQLALELFSDNQQGGFFFTPADGEKLIIRHKEVYDGAVPSGNSAMAYNLLRLSRLTGNASWEQQALRVFGAFAGQVSNYPAAYTLLLCALDFSLGSSREVVVAGDPQSAATRQMLAALGARWSPGQVVHLKTGGEQDQRLAQLAPFTALMKPAADGPAAYVCRDFTCQQPISDPAALAAALQS